MQRVYVLIGIIFLAQLNLKSQIALVGNENFESTLNNWTIMPSYSWMPNTTLHVSGQQSYVGYIPAATGDSIVFVTPLYNLTNYSNVILKFNHICKVNVNDLCQIEYRENFHGAVWQAIPLSAYQGNGIYKNMTFCDSSYTAWNYNNILATPDNSWWKNEQFDISNEVSYAVVQFRFKIKKGSVSGTHFAYGWLIDDFQIYASTHPVIPPEVRFLTYYTDTVFQTGPFPISAKVKSLTSAPIDTPILKYTSFYNGISKNDSILMTATGGDTLWTATIPQHFYGTQINYSIHASDTIGNSNFAQADFYIKRLPPFDSNSVALNQIVLPDSIVQYNTTTPIQLRITNKGLKNLQSAVIYWSVNGVGQTPFSWTGNLPDGFSTQIMLGSYLSGMYGGNDILLIWIKQPNGTNDPVSSDDTLVKYVYNCKTLFNGDYIIGQSSQADFSTINDALLLLKNADCVRGNVTLKIESGIYTQNIDLTNFANYLNVYSLTITSLANHKDSVILNDTAGAIITLNNTNNFYLKNITLDVATRGSYGIQFTGNANNIEIRNCNIYANPTALTIDNAGIIKSDNVNGIASNIRIINNVFDGGFYNILLHAGLANNYGIGCRVDSNICTNADYLGMHLNFFNATSVSYNKISSRSSGYIYAYNIALGNGIVDEVIGNRLSINRQASSTNIYALYLFHLNKTSPNRIIVSNNEIRVNAYSTTSYAVYTHSSKFDFYHNSVYMITYSGGGCGLHLYSCSSSIINNSIHCNILSPCLYSSSNYVSDYNNFYSNSFSLSSWQYSKGSDANSISIFPPYINTANNLELNNYNLFQCPRVSNILYDINGAYRTSTTTMGAYSVPFWEGYNLEMSAIINPENLNYTQCSSTLLSDVKVAIRNAGTDSVNFNINPMQLSVRVSGAVNFQSDTIINVGSLSVGSTDTFTISSLLPTSLNGNYHITVFLQFALDTISSDDTLHSNYVISKIVLPYDVDFSYFPSELLVRSLSGDIVWEQDSGSGSNPTIVPVFGNGRLEFKSSQGIGSLSQAVFQGIDLNTAAKPRLGFWYAHDNVFGREVMLVKLATNDSLQPIVLASLQRFDPSFTTPGWKYYEIDLSSYSTSNCVSIIFEASSFGTGNQNIDRIRLFGYQDLKVSLLLPDAEGFKNCDFTNKSINVILENLSAQNIQFPKNTEVKLEIKGQTTMNYSYQLSDMLSSFTSDTLLMVPAFDFCPSQNYNITTYIQSLDSNSLNDTDKVLFNINPDIVIDSISGVDPMNCKKIGDTIYINVYLKNQGNTKVKDIPVQITINHLQTINDTLFETLASGASALLHFSKPYIVPNATAVQPYYTFSVKANYPCDANISNNGISFLACVEIDNDVDLSIKSIEKPLPSQCDTGLTNVFAKIILENKGNTNLSNVVLCLSVDSAQHIVQQINDTIKTILANNELNFMFTRPYRVPNLKSTHENYKVNVFIKTIIDDSNPLNDTLSVSACAVFNDVSIQTHISSVLWVGQNIPNPSLTFTCIPFSIQQEGEISFKILSIKGQLLYSQELYKSAGTHSLEINTQTFVDGIYYLSIEHKGQKIIKKMTVQH